jgi:hypothetical protein
MEYHYPYEQNQVICQPTWLNLRGYLTESLPSEGSHRSAQKMILLFIVNRRCITNGPFRTAIGIVPPVGGSVPYNLHYTPLENSTAKPENSIRIRDVSHYPQDVLTRESES